MPECLGEDRKIGVRCEADPPRDRAYLDRAYVESDAGNHEAAIAELTEAVRLEGNLLYGEPPEWSVPARHDLGTALLNAGRPAEAQDVIEDSLEQFPDNGWSLYLLSVALRQQDRNEEADEVTGRFQQIWETADVDITSIAYR